MTEKKSSFSTTEVDRFKQSTVESNSILVKSFGCLVSPEIGTYIDVKAVIEQQKFQSDAPGQFTALLDVRENNYPESEHFSLRSPTSPEGNENLANAG